MARGKALLAMQADMRQVYTCALSLKPYLLGYMLTTLKAVSKSAHLPYSFTRIDRVKLDGAIPAVSISCRTCSVRVRICLCAHPSRMELNTMASGEIPFLCIRPSNCKP